MPTTRRTRARRHHHRGQQPATSTEDVSMSDASEAGDHNNSSMSSSMTSPAAAGRPSRHAKNKASARLRGQEPGPEEHTTPTRSPAARKTRAKRGAATPSSSSPATAAAAAAAPSRRRSGRSKKAAVHHDDDQEEEGEREEVEEQEEEHDHDSVGSHSPSEQEDADSDFEADPAPKRAKRKRAKKAGKSGKGTAATHGAKRKSAGGAFSQPSSKNYLMRALKGSANTLKRALDKWVNHYDEVDREQALCHLLTCILHCCGNQGTIEESNLSDLRAAYVDLVAQFPENMGQYPLRQTSGKFKGQAVRFLQGVVDRVRSDILFDDNFTETLINFLTLLSTSQVRAFRHTAVFFGMKLGSLLIPVAQDLAKDVEETQSTFDSLQAEAEEDDSGASSRSKKKGKKAKRKSKAESAKLEQAEEAMLQASERRDRVNDILALIFEGIAIHRYRDVSADIRLVVMEEMGIWITEYSEAFLDDKYLKYFGWELNDRSADVRAAVVRTLTRLFGSEDYNQHMDLFYSKFKNRLLFMLQDESDSVVANIISLMLQLYARERLDEEETKRPWTLCFASNGPVAREAGEYLVQTLIAQLKELCEEDQHEEELELRLTLQTVVRFIAQYGGAHGSERYGLFVDAVWAHMPAIHNWATYVALLEQANDIDKEEDQEFTDTRLASAEEVILLELLVAAVKRATGEGNFRDEKVKQRDANNAVQEITKSFLKALPGLLSKFAADGPKSRALVQVPQYFDMDKYSQNQAVLTRTLTLLRDIFLLHTDSNLLHECMTSFYFFTSSELALANEAEGVVEQITDQVCKTLNGIVDLEIPEDDDEDETKSEEGYKLSACMARLRAHAQSYDVHELHLTKPVLQILEAAASQAILSDTLCAALDLSLFILGCEVEHLNNSDGATENDFNKHVIVRNKFVKAASTLLGIGTKDVKVSALQFISHAVYLYAASPKKLADNAAAWLYIPKPSTQEKALSFVMDVLAADVPAPPEDADVLERFRHQDELELRKDIYALFCRLVSVNAISPSNMAPLIRFYLEDDLTPLLKATLATIRNNDQRAYSQLLIDGLKQWYKDEDEVSEAMRDVAKRLALTFGVEHKRYRQQIVNLHTRGITFALSAVEDGFPTHLSFLELVKEFTMKLANQDKLKLYDYLTNVVSMKNMHPQDTEEWLPYTLLCNTLSGKRAAPKTPGSGRKRGTRRTPSSSARKAGGRGRRSAASKRRVAEESIEDVEDSSQLANPELKSYWGNLSRTHLTADSEDDWISPVKKAKTMRRRPANPQADEEDPIEDDDEEDSNGHHKQQQQQQQRGMEVDEDDVDQDQDDDEEAAPPPRRGRRAKRSLMLQMDLNVRDDDIEEEPTQDADDDADLEAPAL